MPGPSNAPLQVPPSDAPEPVQPAEPSAPPEPPQPPEASEKKQPASSASPPKKQTPPPTAAPTPASRPAASKPAQRPARKPRSPALKAGLTVAGVLAVGLLLVLAARWLRTLTGVEGFIEEYSGHASQPDAAPEGIPGWLGWQHFFNMFLLVLIVRTGLQVRLERRPPGYWTPKKGSFFSPGKQTPTKVSMTQWLHQALDVLWVLNGLIFVILLFSTGHWMRIVPTSWDIFPNMLSAGIQYASLDWPAEHGWVHYNALQVVSYFSIVFIAAPLAIISGLRLSTWWPKQNQRLSKLYPIEAARAVHLPVMVYFVAFTIVHVFLVLFTGALRNLNHIFTARDAVDFWGLVIFLISLLVITAGWLLTSQLFMRPIANTMGTVTKR